MLRIFGTLAITLGTAACRGDAPAAPPAPSSVATSAQLTTAASVAPSPRAELKLATWNLEWLSSRLEAGVVKRRQEDYDRLAKYADRLDADVVAFQEVDGEGAAARVFSPERYAFHVVGEGGVQRTGFAYKRELEVAKHPDYVELDVGGLRAGADLGVRLGNHELRLLAVHLKSGCFDGPLERSGSACEKLAAQLPRLEAWIDARAAEHVPFAVLGDFNRRLFARPDEPFWAELDDGEPPEADLTSPGAGHGAECWGAKHPHFISHIVLGKSAALLVKPGSFAEHAYDVADRPKKSVISDHCPLSIVMLSAPGGSTLQPTASATATPTPPASHSESATGPIKGNLSRKGKKIYHLRNCPDYARTKVTREGERYFATEAEARAAGWEKAQNCPN